MIPSEILLGDDVDQTYNLQTGEHVSIAYLRGINNTKGVNAALLNEISQELYGLPFSRVELAWKMRIGILSDYWYVIKMTKIDDKLT